MFKSYAPIYEAIGEEWVSLRLLHHVRRWLAAAQLQPLSAADLACGTGAAAVALALSGMRVVGVDQSAEMLALARQRAQRAGVAVSWLEQDLRELQLAGPVDLVTSFYDSLNYVLSAADLRLTLERMSSALLPGGVLAFDINTPREYEQWIAGQDVVAHDSGGLFVLSRRSYDAQTRIASGRLIWMQHEEQHWRRGEETQYQRAHEEQEVREALAGAGLVLRARLTLQGAPADEQATRILYVAQKQERLAPYSSEAATT